MRNDVKTNSAKRSEGEDFQPRVTLKAAFGQQLAFEEEGGLFGREKNKRRPLRVGEQGFPRLAQAGVGFAAASLTRGEIAHRTLFLSGRFCGSGRNAVDSANQASTQRKKLGEKRNRGYGYRKT